MINRKVAVFSHQNAYEFQKAVNEFIKDKYVIDIKYCPVLMPMEYTNGVVSKTTFVDRCLIIYEDRRKSE